MNARRPPSRLSFFAAARLVVLLAVCASPLRAQVASQPVPAAGQPGSRKLNAQELGRLLAPIALYPDALVALILPASTVPSDVVLGARYLKSGGDPGQTGSQAWDESVKALARYPGVLAWMDENLEWTSSVGEAFVEQPADVMNAVQALRKQAKAAGNLVETPQQKVVEEENAIRIVPADPKVIYVPQYNPQIVYVDSSVVIFGPGFFVGPWLCYDFDWHRRCFYRGNWCGWNQHNRWGHAPNGNRGGADVVNIAASNAAPWQPSACARRQIAQRQCNNNGNARYVSACPGPANTQQPAAQRNASTRPAQPGIYNPALKTPLPQPSNPVRAAGRDGRAHTGTPANNPPSIPAPSPQNVRTIAETLPARPTRTAPSTAPQLRGQTNSPALPRSGPSELRTTGQPDSHVPESPYIARSPRAASPAAGPANNPIRSKPTRTIPPNPGTSVPTTTQPPQAGPVTAQPSQAAPVIPQRPP